MGVNSSVIVPFVGVEFDASGAFTGPSALPFKALIIGHKKSGSSLADNVPTLALNADDVAAKAGIGSMLHQQARKWFERNRFTETHIISVPEPAGDVQEFTYTVTGTATEAGELPIYIDGERFSVGVGIGSVAQDLATDLAVILQGRPDLMTFIVTETAGVITLVTNYIGAIGSKHNIRSTYLDTDNIPAGLTVAIDAATSPGSGNADITLALEGIAGNWFNVLTMPFDDSTNLDKMEAELLVRFGPDVQQDGYCYFGYSDTAANSITFSTSGSRNSQSMVMIDAYRYTEHPMFVAAMVAAEVARSVENDPGQPLHRITLDTLLPPVASERHTLSTLNTLTKNGIMTLDPHQFGGPQTFGTVTMYLKNSSGIDDPAYRYQNTMYILMFLRYDFVSSILSKFGRARLVDNSDRIQSGLQVISPTIGKAEAVSIARNWETLGLVENVDLFVEEVTCQRNIANPNRLDWILPPDLVNQFIVGSGDMLFRLQ